MQEHLTANLSLNTDATRRRLRGVLRRAGYLDSLGPAAEQENAHHEYRTHPQTCARR
jgi:hypothetical protein